MSETRAAPHSEVLMLLAPLTAVYMRRALDTDGSMLSTANADLPMPQARRIASSCDYDGRPQRPHHIPSAGRTVLLRSASTCERAAVAPSRRS